MTTRPDDRIPTESDCGDCVVYQRATDDFYYRIGENFNNMMHILKAKNDELEDAYLSLKQAQSKMLQQEKLASIGQLAAGIAHEVNNPIGFIHSNLGTLKRYIFAILKLIELYEKAEPFFTGQTALVEAIDELKADEDIQFLVEDLPKLIEESLEGTERVRTIVQDLRDFSRIDSLDMEVADLHHCIDSTINMLKYELNDKVQVVREYGDIPQVECIPSQLNQVFMNLITNAAQAIHDTGAITIKTAHVDDEVVVSVSDTGSGISPELLPKIFDPFVTTKPIGSGTGLGLSISYGIVRRHHGKLEVESTLGKGATFTIRLPVKNIHTVAEEMAEDAKP